MLLPRLTPAQNIVIFSPRYRDKVILIATYKVGTHNLITFTKAKHLPDTYYLSGTTIQKYPIDSNGKIACYAVSQNELQLFEGREG